MIFYASVFSKSQEKQFLKSNTENGYGIRISKGMVTRNLV